VTTRESLPPPLDTKPVGLDSPSLELGKRRTGLSFQRTRMAAERTLMAVIRTALALIGFGFTIFQFFHYLQKARVLPEASHAPGRFGTTLVAIGLLMLAIGIGYHLVYMYGLRRERHALSQQALIHGQSVFPVSLTLLVALALFALGALAVVGMLLRRGPL
jgi:putative membrane protein